MATLILNDSSPFPYGKKYKGTPMEDVPAWYLLGQEKFFKGKPNLSASVKGVLKYIEENYEAILKEQDQQ